MTIFSCKQPTFLINKEKFDGNAIHIIISYHYKKQQESHILVD